MITHAEMAEFLATLGLDPNRVVRLVAEPGIVTATLLSHGENGRCFANPDGTLAVDTVSIDIA